MAETGGGAKAKAARADAWRRRMIAAGALFGGRRYRRFVIVGVARTGSTVLISLLNAHSRAVCFGEIFRSPDAIGWDVRPFAGAPDPAQLARYRADPVAFMQREVYRRWPPRIRAAGFKIFCYHAREAPFAAVWDALAAQRDIAVIHVKRRNRLAQLVSLRRAHLTNMWSSTSPGAARAPRLRLDPDACARHFAETERMEREADALFAGHPLLQVAYEDLDADQAGEMARVFDFLGLPRERVATPLARQRGDRLETAVENHEELRRAFAGGPWSAFFEPEADPLPRAQV